MGRGGAHRRVLAAVVVGGFIGGLALSLLLDGPAAASTTHASPARAPNTRCVPFRPTQPSNRNGYGYLVITEVGSVDATGCDSWVYEPLVAGFPEGFFAGPQFQPGKVAYQYGTMETTAIDHGTQIVTVKNPSKQWLSAYQGYDTCSRTPPGRAKGPLSCDAPAVRRRPDSWGFYIPLGAILVLFLVFVIHFTRPAGPVRRRRRFHRHHRALAAAVNGHPPTDLSPAEVKRLQRRLRRLERSVHPELSESQHRWFLHHVGTGGHRTALEVLARWFAESGLPLPDHLREEFEWLATSLDARHEVFPILDRKPAPSPSEPVRPTVDTDQAQDGTDSPATRARAGTVVDVPLETFRQLVADAVDSLPEELGRAMRNVVVTVEEEATGRDLFGLYIGVPLVQRRHRDWNVHPDRIIIYRKTICEHCRSEEEVRAEVYATVVHEIAHHFGIDDPRLRELGW